MEKKNEISEEIPKIYPVHDCLVVLLPAELDNYQTEKIRKKAELFFQEGRIKNVLFDFTRVSFMDSSAIGMIMGRYKQAKAFGGRVGVFGAEPGILRLLKLSGIQKLFTLFDSKEEASMEFGIPADGNEKVKKGK